MNIKHAIILALSSLLISTSLFSCSETETAVKETTSVQASTEAETSNDDLVHEELEGLENTQEPEEQIPEVVYTNPLSGLACDEYTTTKRPVAMMINNIKKATPQLGIARADIIYECIVEGGITRLMAVFSDYETLPETGSVRSSRDYYLDLAQSHDAIYAHCGGSEIAYSTIASRKIDNIDGVNGSYAESSAYWKNKDRVRAMGYEHASMTNGENLVKSISDMKFRTTLADDFSHPLNFAKESTRFQGTDAISLQIAFSHYAKSFFSYDENEKVYLKGQFSAPHIDGETGNTLSFKNIIILYAPYKNTGDSYGHLELNFTGNGYGMYISEGQAKSIVWKKYDRQTPYSLYEQDGTTPLLLNPGKTYIGITNSSHDVTVCPDQTYIVE